MSAADLLLAARAVLAEPEHWTQGHEAVTASGAVIGCVSKAAHRFCMAGALIRAHWDTHTGESAYDDAYRHLMRATCSTVTAFNDAPHRTHAQVLDAFDAAIRLAKDAES